MGDAIGQILTFAVGVAISPIPIIAVILMLFSNKAAANSLSFLGGWLIGLLGAGLLVLALNIQASDGAPSDTSGYIKIAIGALFLFLAWHSWSNRPKAGEKAQTPSWMAAMTRGPSRWRSTASWTRSGRSRPACPAARECSPDTGGSTRTATTWSTRWPSAIRPPRWWP